MVNLKGRSLLTLRDYSSDEIRFLLELSVKLKEKKRKTGSGELLKGKNIVLLFEKTSTRTRCAFETAAFDEGGRVTYLTNSQMGKKESLEDTAIILGRFYHGIAFRGFKQETVEDLARFSGVPVWNGLTDLYHPTQALADAMTLLEGVGKPAGETKWVFCGDGRNNVAVSLMIISAKLGLHFALLCPQELSPDPGLVQEMTGLAEERGGSLWIGRDREAALKEADAVYTDVWVSMGEEDRMEERIRLLKPYQVNRKLMALGRKGCLFLHCLPAFHDLNTGIGREVYEKYGLESMEVTDEVFRSSGSRVFDQAENRVHTIKAVMAATLVEPGSL
ncbi:MAG: ornithine carbamoyltransferase [Spirochaetales bacterium]|jgi:ornithine carbamoyltransferase|nr:ornithine carbamoyltransferase [Spirochaetales bacterium]